jgi:predicted membrane-bound spermidine synthase
MVTPHEHAAATNRRLVAVAGVLFLCSGIPALVYQVCWQRILCLHSGVGIYSVAIIVAAFMLGLGIGCEVGGMLSARISPRQALRTFALLEVATGAFALVSCWLYYDWLYHRAFWTNASWWQLMAAHFAVLVLPTTLMGMTLPMLVRATVWDARTACGTISFLYGANTLGAAIGAAITPWVLIGFLGVRGAVAAGAAVNVAVGLSALLLLRSRAAAQTDVKPIAAGVDLASSGMTSRVGASLPLPIWGVLYALSGFIALGLEMVWFRVLDVAIKSNSLTYGTVLAIFLGGLAVGCWIGGRVAEKSVHPLGGFLACQCGSLIYAAAAVWLLAYAPRWLPGAAVLLDYWRQYEGLSLRSLAEWRMAMLLYIGLPMALYFVPTVLMGLSFGYLQRAVQDDPRTSGRKVGVLQAANILGSTLGSAIVGLVCLNLLGTMGSLRGLMGAGIVFALVGIGLARRRTGFAGAAAAMAMLMTLLPDASHWWPRLHGVAADTAFAAEDASGVAVIGPSLRSDVHVLWLNGKGQSGIPVGGIHVQLGALPAILHPHPEDIAVIGLGGGGTAFAAHCRPETQRLRVFEICSALQRVLPEFLERHPDHSTLRLFDSSHAAVIAADGRNAIVRGSTQYDIIEADAIRQDGAYSGNLYSVEFFASCAARLKPGGLFCTWAPTLATRKAFCEVFPHVVTFDAPILIGSLQPIPIDPAQWRERASSAGVRDWLGDEFTNLVLAELSTCRPYDRSEIAAVSPNRDLFPRDEFDSTRYIWWRLFVRLGLIPESDNAAVVRRSSEMLEP